jgi:catechol 2,3-dioxygenase-like lactoylglutathione lyase family enzyme
MAELHLDRIDHFVMAATDLEPAYKALTRLGIVANPPGPAGDTANDNCFFNFGGPEQFCAVEWIRVRDRARVEADPAQSDLLRLVDAGGGAYFIGFPVESLDPAREVFGARGGYTESEVRVLDDEAIITFRPHDTAAIGCPILLLEYPPAVIAVQPEMTSVVHGFPLEHLDHLAIVPADFEASTRYWTDVLGVPMHAEIEAPTFVIRQMKVGSVMVELLKPSGATTLPAGLLPSMACEVADVDACADLARERGFTVTDPAPGLLPGTRITRFDPAEMAGLALQLLQYV